MLSAKRIQHPYKKAMLPANVDGLDQQEEISLKESRKSTTTGSLMMKMVRMATTPATPTKMPLPSIISLAFAIMGASKGILYRSFCFKFD
jgi:hypothetical protein